MAEGAVVRIDRRSSIETEPRTLKISQIRSAREAAMYVLSTKTIEEAMAIFTQGLEPAVKKAKQDTISGMDSTDHQLIEEPQITQFQGLTDVASAPF